MEEKITNKQNSLAKNCLVSENDCLIKEKNHTKCNSNLNLKYRVASVINAARWLLEEAELLRILPHENARFHQKIIVEKNQ